MDVSYTMEGLILTGNSSIARAESLYVLPPLGFRHGALPKLLAGARMTQE